MQPRVPGLQYFVEHLHGQLLLLTNAVGGQAPGCLLERAPSCHWDAGAVQPEGKRLSDLKLSSVFVSVFVEQQSEPHQDHSPPPMLLP